MFCLESLFIQCPGWEVHSTLGRRLLYFVIVVLLVHSVLPFALHSLVLLTVLLFLEVFWVSWVGAPGVGAVPAFVPVLLTHSSLLFSNLSMKWQRVSDERLSAGPRENDLLYLESIL